MPAATSKEQLLTVTNTEYGKLQIQLAKVDDGLSMAKDDDDTSIKDVIAHRSHWIELFIGWYTDGAAGLEVFFPAEGYKWNDLKRYNADLREKQADLDWQDACSALDESHQVLVAFVEEHTDNELYGGPMEGANNKWTPGRWAEAAGPSHYRSAAKYIRARLRD